MVGPATILERAPHLEGDFTAWEHELLNNIQLSVLEVPEMTWDERCRERADTLISYAGALAVSASAEVSIQDSSPSNLLEGIRMAEQGDEIAKRMVLANIHTDVFERTIKAGFVIPVVLERDGDNKIIQNGQTNEQIQLNTLRYLGSGGKMQPRYEAEVRNSYRLQSALEEGLLEDYNFVVISLCADDMTDKELDEEGFFVPTKSLSVQSTGLDADILTTESSFMAGVSEEGGKRHDAGMVAKFGDSLGVDLRKNAAGIIDTPVLIPKSMMPNGVVDIVRMLDDVNSGTFFGQNKPKQDYVKFRDDCKQREEDMAPTVDKIYTELIATLARLKTPLEATAMLNKLSGEHTLRYAVKDDKIDARVFGTQAAWALQDARAHYATGDMLRVEQATRAAVRLETSSSCPGGKSAGVTTEIDIFGNEVAGESSETETLTDCDFVSLECPECHKKNVHTVCKNGRYYGACGCVSK